MTYDNTKINLTHIFLFLILNENLPYLTETVCISTAVLAYLQTLSLLGSLNADLKTITINFSFYSAIFCKHVLNFLANKSQNILKNEFIVIL